MTFKNRFYPHLLPWDIPLWEAFLDLHGQDYDRFEYDIRVGRGRPAPRSLPTNIRKMALDLSMRRIDVVGHTSARIDIIEVTRVADLKAVGQLMTYPRLYRATYEPTLPVRPVLVLEHFHTDILQVIQELNLVYYLLSPNTGSVQRV